ncbi:hypothetical protein Tco_1249694, partial [Tanacetum coccineum]
HSNALLPVWKCVLIWVLFSVTVLFLLASPAKMMVPEEGPFLSLLKDHSRCIVLLSSRLKDGGDKVYLGWLYKAHQCARALALDSMMFWNFKVSKILGIFCSVDVIGRLMVDSQRPW